jgi:hypothetical protein
MENEHPQSKTMLFIGSNFSLFPQAMNQLLVGNPKPGTCGLLSSTASDISKSEAPKGHWPAITASKAQTYKSSVSRARLAKAGPVGFQVESSIFAIACS